MKGKITQKCEKATITNDAATAYFKILLWTEEKYKNL